MSSRDLRVFLAYYHLTQTAFSKMVNVTKAMVSLWCNGKIAIPQRVEEFCKNYEIQQRKDKRNFWY